MPLDISNFAAEAESDGTGGGVTPTGQEWINVLATPFSNVRWNSIFQSSTHYFGGFVQSDSTQNDEITFQKYLQAGTYTMDVFHSVGTTRGIYSIFIDGVQLGTTIDGFNAAGSSQRATIANLVIAGSTIHSIRFLMAAKNASSTGFQGILDGIAFTRTGS